MTTRSRILILGAGMMGMALAAALAHNGFDVVGEDASIQEGQPEPMRGYRDRYDDLAPVCSPWAGDFYRPETWFAEWHHFDPTRQSWIPRAPADLPRVGWLKASMKAVVSDRLRRGEIRD